MFDVGFLEILIVAILTLVVVGPDRLPGTIHFIGRWVGKIRESFNAVRIEIEREVQAEEFRKRFQETVNDVQGSVDDARENASEIENSIADSLRHSSVNEEDFQKQAASRLENEGK